MTEYVRITTFDDGREPLSQHPNEWIIIRRMFGGGKLALRNAINGTVIDSISAWKTAATTPSRNVDA